MQVQTIVFGLLLALLKVCFGSRPGNENNNEKWRLEDRKRKDLQREIEILDDQVEIETRLYGNLSHFQEKFDELTNYNSSEKGVVKGSTDDELDVVRGLVADLESKVVSSKAQLLAAEVSMETKWADPGFHVAFDYVMNGAYLAPQPALAKPNNEEYKKVLKSREKIILNEIKNLKHLLLQLKAFNARLDGFEGHLRGATIFPEILHEKYESLRAFIQSTANFSISAKETESDQMKRTSFYTEAVKERLDAFEMFMNTQLDEWRLAYKTGYKDNVAAYVKKTSASIDHPDSSWSQRLVNKTKKSASDSLKLYDLIPAHLIEPLLASRNYVENKAKSLEKISKNIAQVNEHYKSFQNPTMCEFILQRYSEILEVTHRYMVRHSAPALTGVRPQTFFTSSVQLLTKGLDEC
jgi:hypothetical protein